MSVQTQAQTQTQTEAEAEAEADAPHQSILSWLPTELLIHILSDPDFRPPDRANISLTCRAFQCINTPILYTENVRYGDSSCLFWAARHGRIGTMQNAVAAGAHLNTNGWFAEDEVGGADVDTVGRVTTPLHVAARFGQRQVAEWLIDNGADINAASYKYCDALVVYWRQYFTSVWRPGWTPLFAALNHRQASTAELLVSRQAKSTNTRTGKRQLFVPALHVAAANGVSSVIKLLSTAQDFHVDCHDFNGNTALHYASQYWPQTEEDDLHLDSSPIPLLISLGADIEAVNNRLQNPLIHACWMGNFRAATLLVRAGANPKAECYIREVQKLVRPLYLVSLSRSDIARQSGREPHEDESAFEDARSELFQALFGAGVDVNDRLTYSRFFDAPMLQRVCLDNNYFAAQTLIHVAGADVNATDGQGQTTLLGYLRRLTKRPSYSNASHIVSDMLALLLRSGARLDIPDDSGTDGLQLATGWVLADEDPASCLQTLLRCANASNVSKTRVLAAIDSCYDQPATSSHHAVTLLLDFLEANWIH